MNDGRPGALITGIDGQDGSYLAELLLGRGYDVWGTAREDPDAVRPNLAAIHERITLVTCDLRDPGALPAAIERCRPDELYNLAATTYVPQSWDDPLETIQVNATAVTAMLDAVARRHRDTRVYQASSSEVFGVPADAPQTEATPLRPVNPYGIAKLHAQLSAAAYREREGIHVSVGITFNHESPRRPPSFVTRKVTRAAAAIKLGLEHEVVLGSLDARRDWGDARDYVEAMWRMLQRDAVVDELRRRGHEPVLHGALADAEPDAWAWASEAAARDVAEGRAEQGVVCCWTGTGASIAANKVAGARAALCGDAQTAEGARRWNDANVLALSLRTTSEAELGEILDAWFGAGASSDADDLANVRHVGEIEESSAHDAR